VPTGTFTQGTNSDNIPRTYGVAMRRVRLATVAVEKQYRLHILWVLL